MSSLGSSVGDGEGVGTINDGEEPMPKKIRKGAKGKMEGQRPQKEQKTLPSYFDTSHPEVRKKRKIASVDKPALRPIPVPTVKKAEVLEEVLLAPKKVEKRPKRVKKSPEKVKKSPEKVEERPKRVVTRSQKEKGESTPEAIKCSPPMKVKEMSNTSQGSAKKRTPRVEVMEQQPKQETTPEAIKCASPRNRSSQKRKPAMLIPALIPAPSTSELPWVDKYRPTSINQLAGLQGDQSAMRKLLRWLMAWPENNLGAASKEKKARAGPYSAQGGDGSAYKAVLIHGAPGIGKTTCAELCCRELNLAYRETNASEARNKKSVADIRSSSEDIGHFVRKNFGYTNESDLRVGSRVSGIQHVLIMDEVDGMSGNADRMGMFELIQMIKKTSVPIICICNDHQKQSIRSGLANHCYDIRFTRPRVEQIRAHLMKIVAAEGIKITPEVVDQIIEASHQDIRQCIHSLQLYASGNGGSRGGSGKGPFKKLHFEKKDVAVNSFDSAASLLSSSTSLHEKVDRFFADYAWMPLFVHENYVSVQQKGIRKSEQMSRLRRAADSIAEGDLVEKWIRSNQSWNLLPDQAMLSSVLPALTMNGHLTKRVDFPKWFGKNSNSQKRRRLAQHLSTLTYSKFACGEHSLVEEYLPVLRERMYRPLVENDSAGVKDSLPFFLHYSLQKDDVEAINELGAWPGKEKDIAQQVKTAAKSVLTRALNKESRKMASGEANTIIGAAIKAGKGKAKEAVVVELDEAEGGEAQAKSEEEAEDVPIEEMLY